MTVEADIFARLGSLTSNRVYPDVAPENPTKPYIVYQQVGGEAYAFLDSTLPDKKHARIQVAVWATTRAAAAALALQIESQMVTASAFQARALGAPVSDYEPDTQPPLYGTRQDFSVRSSRT